MKLGPQVHWQFVFQGWLAIQYGVQFFLSPKSKFKSNFFSVFQSVSSVQSKEMVHSIQATHPGFQQEYCEVVEWLEKFVSSWFSLSMVARLLPYQYLDGTHQFHGRKLIIQGGQKPCLGGLLTLLKAMQPVCCTDTFLEKFCLLRWMAW